MLNIDFKERIDCAQRYYELFESINLESANEAAPISLSDWH